MSDKRTAIENTWAAECRYLAGLLETRGDQNVPPGAMRSYFAVQTASAKRHDMWALAATLEAIGAHVATDGTLTDGMRANDAAAVLRANAIALDGNEYDDDEEGR